MFWEKVGVDFTIASGMVEFGDSIQENRANMDYSNLYIKQRVDVAISASFEETEAVLSITRLRLHASVSCC